MAANVEDAFYSSYEEKGLGKSSGVRRYSEDNTTPEFTEDEDEVDTPDASDWEYDDKDRGIDTDSLD